MASRRDKDDGAVRKAFLKDALARGPVAVSDLEREARTAGLLRDGQRFKISKPFKTAKRSLGIRSNRSGFGPDGRWLWLLPTAPELSRAPLCSALNRAADTYVDGVTGNHVAAEQPGLARVRRVPRQSKPIANPFDNDSTEIVNDSTEIDDASEFTNDASEFNNNTSGIDNDTPDNGSAETGNGSAEIDDNSAEFNNDGTETDSETMIGSSRPVVSGWASIVDRLAQMKPPCGTPPHRWRGFLADCYAFLQSPKGWAERAADLGWTAKDLFASPALGHGTVGLLWTLNGGEVIELHSDWALIAVAASRTRRVVNRQSTPASKWSDR